jgi:hypothetical protein
MHPTDVRTYIPACIPTHIPYKPTYETVPCLSVRCPPSLCTPLTCQTDMHMHAHIYHPHTPLLILFSCILHPLLPVSHSLSRLPFFSVSRSLPGSLGLLPPPITHTHSNRHYFVVYNPQSVGAAACTPYTLHTHTHTHTYTHTHTPPHSTRNTRNENMKINTNDKLGPGRATSPSFAENGCETPHRRGDPSTLLTPFQNPNLDENKRRLYQRVVRGEHNSIDNSTQTGQNIQSETGRIPQCADRSKRLLYMSCIPSFFCIVASTGASQ